MKKIKNVNKSILTKISGAVNMGKTPVGDYDPNKVYKAGDRVYYPQAVEDGVAKIAYFKCKEDGTTGPFDISKWVENTIDQELGQVHLEQNTHRRELFAATSKSGILTPFKGSNYNNDVSKVWVKGIYGSKGRIDSMSTLYVSAFEAIVAGIHVRVSGDIDLNVPDNPHFQKSTVVNDRAMKLPYFVALEVWLEEMDEDDVAFSTDRGLIKYRFRTFDQNKAFKRDGITVEGDTFDQYNSAITAQGANDSVTTGDKLIHRFHSNDQRKNPKLFDGNGILKNDSGVYIAGDGSDESKQELGTMDGYVYLIPLFFVGTRYLSTQVSIDEDSYYDRTLFSPKISALTLKNAGTFYSGELITVIGDKVDDVEDLKVRDLKGEAVEYPLYLTNSPRVKLNADISAVLLSMEEVNGKIEYTFRMNGDRNKKVTLAVGHIFSDAYIESSSPDGEYSGMVTYNDIVELYHVIDNAGMDFLLADSFNKLLRGELDTNNKYELTRQQLGLQPAHGVLPSVHPTTVGDRKYLVNLMFMGTNNLALFEPANAATNVRLSRGRILVSRTDNTSDDCVITMRTNMIAKDINVPKISTLVKNMGPATANIELAIGSQKVTETVGTELFMNINNPTATNIRDGKYFEFTITIKNLKIGERVSLYDAYVMPHNETDMPKIELGITPRNIVMNQYPYSSDKEKNADILVNWKKVVASRNSTVLGLNHDGTVWAWGSNGPKYLGLGNGPGVPTQIPNPIQLGTDNDWVDISISSSHLALVNSKGEMYTCGSNSRGELGLEHNDSGIYTLQKVPMGDWIRVSCGSSFTLGMKKDGTLWSTGLNSEGQLGLGDSGLNTDRNKFTQVILTNGTGLDNAWSDIYCGKNFAIARNSVGEIYVWGGNEYGQLGVSENNTDPKNIPYKLNGNWSTKISCSDGHVMAISASNKVYAWGRNHQGQLGLNDKTIRYIPTLVDFGNQVANDVSTGTDHSLIVVDNTLYVCGKNEYGQFGSNDKVDSLVPKRIGVESDNSWAKVTAGNSYSLGVKRNSTLWSWGSNFQGQLGLGDFGSGKERTTPTSLSKTITLNTVDNKPFIDGSFNISFDSNVTYTHPTVYVIVPVDLEFVDLIHTNYLEYKDLISIQFAQVKEDLKTVDGQLNDLNTSYIRLKDEVKELHLFIRSTDDTKPVDSSIIFNLFFSTDPIRTPRGAWYVPYQYFLPGSPETTPSSDRYYNTAEVTGSSSYSFEPKSGRGINGGIVEVATEDSWSPEDTIVFPFGNRTLTDPVLKSTHVTGTWVVNYVDQMLVFTVDTVDSSKKGLPIEVDVKYIIPSGRGLNYNPRDVHAIDVNGLPYVQSDIVTVSTGFWEENTHLADFYTSATETAPFTRQELFLLADPEGKAVRKEYSEANGVVKVKLTFDILQAFKHQYNATEYEITQLLAKLTKINDLFKIRVIGTTSNGFNNKAIMRIKVGLSEEVRTIDNMNNSEHIVNFGGSFSTNDWKLVFTIESDRLDGSKPGFIDLDFVEVILNYPNESVRKTDLMFVPRESRAIKSIHESAFALNINVIPGFYHWTPEVLGTGGFFRNDILVFGTTRSTTAVLSIESPPCHIRDNTPFVFTLDPSSYRDSDPGASCKMDITFLDRYGDTISTINETLTSGVEVIRFKSPRSTHVVKFTFTSGDNTKKFVLTRPMVSVDNVAIDDYRPTYRLGRPSRVDGQDHFTFVTPTRETLGDLHVYTGTMHEIDGKYGVDTADQIRDIATLLKEDGNTISHEVTEAGKRAAIVLEFSLRELIHFQNIRDLVDMDAPESPFKLALTMPIGNQSNVSVMSRKFLDTTAIDMDKESIAKELESTGIIRYVIFGEMATSTTSSKLAIDKSLFNITFSDDMQYIGKNVVYVDRTTREVSTEFSTQDKVLNEYGTIDTWYDHLPISTVEDLTTVTILQEAKDILITDLGLNNVHKYREHQYQNPLQYLGMDVEYMHGDLGFASIPFAADSKDINIGSIIKINKDGVAEGFHNQVSVPVIKKPMVGIFRYLVNHNGEVKLLVVSSKSTDGNIMLYSPLNTQVRLYSLPGRPETDYVGTVRKTVRENTSLMTPTGEVQGYLDEHGDVIAMYS